MIRVFRELPFFCSLPVDKILKIWRSLVQLLGLETQMHRQAHEHYARHVRVVAGLVDSLRFFLVAK